MKSILKFISMVLATVIFATMVTPTVTGYAAKEFTYAEQNSKKQVIELTMKSGEKTDLCFKGVPDYAKYTCKWISSNEEVATVDGKGVITAKSQGTVKISLILGDGKAYTSKPVEVTVLDMTLTAGNSINKAMRGVELKKGSVLDLNFYGVTDWSERKNVYLTEWTTSNVAVAAVDQSNGIVTAVAEGTAVVIFHLYDMEKDMLLSSTPVIVIVAE